MRNAGLPGCFALSRNSRPPPWRSPVPAGKTPEGHIRPSRPGLLGEPRPPSPSGPPAAPGPPSPQQGLRPHAPAGPRARCGRPSGKARTCARRPPPALPLTGPAVPGDYFGPGRGWLVGGGTADAPYTAGPGSPGPRPGAPSLGSAGPGPRRARRPNMATAGAAFLGAGRRRRPPR